MHVYTACPNSKLQKLISLQIPFYFCICMLHIESDSFYLEEVNIVLYDIFLSPP